MTLAGLFTTKETGDSAERIAEQYLIERGLVLVARNYRCRFGEIDLVMKDRETLVFVEVRLRRTHKGNDRCGARSGNRPLRFTLLPSVAARLRHPASPRDSRGLSEVRVRAPDKR